MLKTFQSHLLNMGRSTNRLKKRTLERLAQKNYYTARAYYHYKLSRADNRYEEPPLLIHQMGKVGSSSVTESLRRAKMECRIYHTHTLDPVLIDKYEKQRREYLSTSREADLKHIWQYQHLRQQIRHGFKGKKWKIVTLVRDPLARNLSDFFEHVEIAPATPNGLQKFQSVEYDFEITAADPLEELIRLFFEKYNHEGHVTYFDREIKDIFDVDLFATDFPTERGYKIYRAKTAEVLLIRLENLNDCFTEAMKEFLNIDRLALVRTNVTGNKEIAALYRRFKETIRFPESFLDRIYSSRFARQFYSPAEIDRFRAKWSRKAARLSGVSNE